MDAVWSVAALKYQVKLALMAMGHGTPKQELLDDKQKKELHGDLNKILGKIAERPRKIIEKEFERFMMKLVNNAQQELRDMVSEQVGVDRERLRQRLCLPSGVRAGVLPRLPGH